MLIFLFIAVIVLHTHAITKEECEMDLIKQPVSVATRNICPKTNELPSADDIAYTINTEKLHDFTFVTHSKSKLNQHNKPSVTNHHELISHDKVQFKIGRIDDKLIIFFPGTDNMNDVTTDLTVSHDYRYIGDQKIHTHSGILKQLEHPEWIKSLQFHIARIGSHMYKKLIISGHSLGAAYAQWFFIMLYQSRLSRTKISHTDHNDYLTHSYDKYKYLKKKGFDQLPRRIEDVTVITYAGPFIIFHEDVNKVDKELRSRIFNFINYQDPVPMMLSGDKPLIKKKTKMDLIFSTWTKQSATEMGTNGMIGKYFVVFHGNPEIINGLIYKHRILNRHYWFVPFYEEDKSAVKYGAECLWEYFAHDGVGVFKKKLNMGISKTKVGMLAAKYHPFKVYFERMKKGCIGNYLSSQSKWYRKHNQNARRRLYSKLSG